MGFDRMERMEFGFCREPRGFSLARFASVAGMLAALSACSSLSGGAEDPGRPNKGSILSNLVMGGPEPDVSKAEPPPVQTRFPDAVNQGDDFECPVLDVAANGASLRDFASGANDSGGLRHQISITRLARECKDAGSNISMKLGVEGSVLLGPSGAPGTFTVPLVFEARLNDKVIASRRETVSVSVPPSEARAFYSTVITDFVIPKDNDVELYVGLSQGGGTPLAPPKHRKAHTHRKKGAVAASAG
jgi:hypothetical protein